MLSGTTIDLTNPFLSLSSSNGRDRTPKTVTSSSLPMVSTEPTAPLTYLITEVRGINGVSPVFQW
jgi:hypothetical protein